MIWMVASIVAVLTMVFGMIAWRQTQQIKHLNKRLEANQESLRQFALEKQTLLNADLRFNQQLKEIHQQILSLDKQIQANGNIRNNDGGYQHALKILSMGGTKEEIMNSCHLSNAEAELLMNLNAYRTAMTK
ncbi:DUF2802 domain-containing protein [Legionella sp. W05-934-2]|jgi:hypothetical protein|uniref:DUF2802 domain-containing protein n=1 Tax=Legionella sp. W05-934-2 TaxID=1198649 RepID=UPI003461FBAD